MIRSTAGATHIVEAAGQLQAVRIGSDGDAVVLLPARSASYAVLVHDAFSWGSRRLAVERISWRAPDRVARGGPGAVRRWTQKR
ncbi:hypothetical protein [Microbacterium sp. Leaf288]|uniref:hypothetical protein n=1 Tax=Microbacterium sp. Leaf288 TaxID=1736323 RepID=UPI000A4E54E4|nr:hypothetical protein [Microbacterium sp. Leaf288]